MPDDESTWVGAGVGVVAVVVEDAPDGAPMVWASGECGFASAVVAEVPKQVKKRAESRQGQATGANNGRNTTMTNDELQASVSDELSWDPKIDSDAIAVSANNGEVTLRGTVGSFRQKREAKKAAERVYGVTTVNNTLDVRILDEYGREDADLRGAVLQAMALDSLIMKTINARADNGSVKLTGTAAWQYQREEAESAAGNVPGVVEVDDQIALTTPQPKAGDIQHSIEKALQRDAKLDAEGLSVETRGNLVKLSGPVSSWVEHDAAVDAAWAAPGVTDVEDRIVVEY
jgi:osmotically-inducible protein OsmY